MKTRKPIAAISYNTKEFLQLKLEELRKAKLISLWFFIEHKPEEDEKKAHIHLWVLPAKTIQTDDILEELVELKAGENKPLKTLHFAYSNFADWYLYAIHDKSYLYRKMQSRKYSYTMDDVVASDRDELEEMVHEIDMTDQGTTARLLNAFEQGLSFQEAFKRGNIPVPMISQYEKAWQLLSPNFHKTERNGRTTHTPKEPVYEPGDGVHYEMSEDGKDTIAWQWLSDPETGERKMRKWYEDPVTGEYLGDVKED